MSTLRTIRFCRTPISFTDLPEQVRVFAEHSKDLLVYMGDQLWSFMELWHQCKAHPELRNPNTLTHALICFLELGLVRTEESAFLEETVHKFERALDGTITFQDIQWRSNQLGVRIGGEGNMWTINSIAYSLGGLLRGIMNSIETVYTSPENGEQFLVNITRKNGKSPMDIRREILKQIRALADAGGATQEQLQAILRENQPPTNPVGLAARPEEEALYPWVRWLGDHFVCLRCLNHEPLDQNEWTHEKHAAYASRHETCLPSERLNAELVIKLIKGELSQSDGEGGDE